MGRKPATQGTAPAVAVPDKKRSMPVVVKSGGTIEEAMAELAVSGTARNASTVISFSDSEYPHLSLAEMAKALQAQGEAVNAGDLSAAERLLSAQAASLNAIFNEMARRAALNMGEYISATETYMRLALKAQAQCRVTLVALAEMKNPRPVAFVQQANIAAGLQQVNNGAPPVVELPAFPDSRTGCAWDSKTSANELLENRS